MRAGLALISALGMITASGIAAGAQEERTKVRLLYSFEQASEARELLEESEHVDIDIVQDNGVTQGGNCARFVFKKGAAWAYFTLGKDAIRNWSDFDYFAMDVYAEDTNPYRIVFELWDGLTRNYHTRCTFENTSTHPGRQTLMWQINRAKRNGKEGREWQELEPQDKIRMDGLTKVKIFMTPLKDRDAVFWVDNLRLMQEDAAKPKMKVPLPEGAVGFDFGSAGAVVPGFKAVTEITAYGTGGGCGFTSTDGLKEDGKGWPDLLTGKFVWSPSSGQMEFRADVPDGEYLAWLSAGRVVRPDLKSRRFFLELNGQTIVDENPSFEEFCTEKHLYRFMWTQYSEKPHALWQNYISRMYPASTHSVTVTGGVISLRAVNHFLSALILVPADKRPQFDAVAADLRRKRIEAFEKTYYTPPQQKPVRRQGDGEYLLYVPDSWQAVRPWSAPSDDERARRTISTAAAPGQRIVLRVAVVPFIDLGTCSLAVSDLRGPAVIPSANAAVHFQNYRSDGTGVSEMALLPSRALQIEAGVTQCYWLWLAIPPDAPAGIYRGALDFFPRSQNVPPAKIPVQLEVYPFQLEPVIPVSYGMYYGGRGSPSFPNHLIRDKYREQLEWMKDIGFTAVSVGGPGVTGVNIGAGNVSMNFNGMRFWMDLAREVGLARSPEQELMANALGMARTIGRRLPGSIGAKVDQDPGIELRQPEFKALHLNASQQYKAFLDQMGLPVAVEVVDEPREVPNPWNRNLADTIAYADMLHEAGLRTFVTPMGDSNQGKDYTVLAEHVDIISVHAYPGSKGQIMSTREHGKTLWLYNTGKDRFSWGFYNWRVGSKGRWEWHFCWSEGGSKGGYPGDEWYNPFTSRHGLAPNAPYSKYRGGMLFQSAYLSIAEGVNDYRYLHTLEKAIEASRAAGTNLETVGAARAFLEALKRVIPEFPRIKGIATPEDGALVGMGIEGDAVQYLDDWRTKIAEFLRVLKR